ncbi:TetR/AcrR family transcriptional regulator [Pseudalkalibacillus decolorationis]|uniref:TetR/AcrR family transcriptional regulator n=1 Tax=Pseudalkalibacillus decolorationis TaxID=163879 RepID=UPI002147D917|nr:TetR/AcrR family transcriptional regulator [Pseudalkalibacillus decolorationis]
MTKSKILDVACKQLAEKGYERTTLSSIAKEVGIKTPSIYAFFKSKEDLFMAVYKDLLEHHFCYIQQSLGQMKNGTVKEMLYQILKDVCDYHLSQLEKTASYTRLAFFLPLNLNEEVKRIFNDMEEFHYEILLDIFSKGIEQGILKDQPRDDLIASFLCLMDGIFLELFYYQEDKFQRRFEQIWNIYWNGICNE